MSAEGDKAINWHQLDLKEVLEKLQYSGKGLASEEAHQRLERFGPNELIEKGRKSLWMMFLDQFKDFMILVLIAAAVVAGVIGEPSKTIAIAVIVLLNAVPGFVQEYRAEKAIAALKKRAAPSATVIRDGRPEVITAQRLVPGDLVVLEAGRRAFFLGGGYTGWKIEVGGDCQFGGFAPSSSPVEVALGDACA